MSKENNETMKTKQEIILPESGNNEIDQKLIDNFLSHSDEEYRQMGKEIKEAERKREEEEERGKEKEEREKEEKERKKEEEKRKKKEQKIERLKGDTDAILNDLKKNHVKIEKHAEMMGYKGKKVYIELPAIGKFEGFKFDYFVSYEELYKNDFGHRSELRKKSYSMKEISKLLQAINKYMIELKGNDDGNVDYENKLKNWKTDVRNGRCNAGKYLRAITGLNYEYWLRDRYVPRIWSSCLKWYCKDRCYVYRVDWNNSVANLLLKLSD